MFKVMGKNISEHFTKMSSTLNKSNEEKHSRS